MKDKNIHTKLSEVRRMRDPRTGQLKDVDMSLVALSRTMENIRKSAEIINKPDSTFEAVVNRFDYIKELVLDHAQFSPRLYNLQVRIIKRTIEVVSNIEELEKAKTEYIRDHFISKAEKLIKKGKEGIEQALTLLEKSRQYIESDPHIEELIEKLKKMV